MKSFLILTTAIASLGVLSDVPNETLAPVSGTVAKVDDTTGTIVGKVVFDGERPEPKPALTIKEKESEGCLHGGSGVDTEDRTLMVAEDGGVANVVLLVKADVERVMPSEPFTLDQKGCRFEPHVLVVPAGATLRFDNSDDTNHNIHTFARKNQPINKNVAGGSNLDQKVDKAETIEIKCDVHTWMKGYVMVTEASSWAVSGSDGSFKLEGVPAGDYKIDVWHEDLGKSKTETVTVKAGENSELNYAVGVKKKSGGGRRRR